ncbi:MAG: DsbA family protein, partial [Hyphomicrobiales bacterium]|nr:DsbA family protein [Hyphomicrobiales bacterium]
QDAEQNKAISDNADALFRSAKSYTAGNPDGDVTVVEFFDYNCGYCKKTLDDLAKLAKENPDLRIVLRDFPVLGQGSMEAAQVAMAVAKQIQGDKFWAFHQALLGARGHAGKEQALAAAREAGVDMKRLEKDMKSPDIRAGYAEVMHIADKLSLTGTPSWVVGKEVIVGAVGYSELSKKIENFRKCGKTACG